MANVKWLTHTPDTKPKPCTANKNKYKTVTTNQILGLQ
jgi:hypothetical protein